MTIERAAEFGSKLKASGSIDHGVLARESSCRQVIKHAAGGELRKSAIVRDAALYRALFRMD